MTEDRIRDLPRHKKVRDDADALLALSKILKPFLRILPAENREAIRNLTPEKIAALRDDAERLVTLLDRFNTHFADRGWIAFDGLDIPTATAAVELADTGKLEEAERKITEYWTKDTIRFHISQLKRVDAFRPRWQLAVDAEDLYAAGKYHAATLLVLAVMDGMVQEVNARHVGVNKNFSAEATVLEAWDSIAAHSTGLGKIKVVMLQARKKTNTDPISIPYRHGVVHGMDVNFNHRIVAAKAWATLFAVGDWAYLAEKGQLEEPEPEPTKSLIEQWREIKATMDDTKVLEQAITDFRPRTAWRDGKTPRRGTLADYEPDTPEHALVQFLEWWRSRNYGTMATAITVIGKPTNPGDIRAWFERKELLDFEITNVEDYGPARTVVSVTLRIRQADKEWTTNADVAMTKKAENAAELATARWTFFDYYGIARPPR